MIGDLAEPRARDQRPGDAKTSHQEANSGAKAIARARRRRDGGLVLVAQVLIVLLIIAGMYALNAVAGKLTMPRPDAVLQQSIKMWADGTMLKALLESLTVL